MSKKKKKDKVVVAQKAVTIGVQMNDQDTEYFTICPGDYANVTVTTKFTNNFTGKDAGSFQQLVKVYLVEENEKYIDDLLEDFED